MSEYSRTPSFNSTPLGSTITEFSFSLMAEYDGHRYASGTAIVIAPHLAITARHVIDDYWQMYHPNIPFKEFAEAKFSLQALNIIDGKSIGIWDVTRLWSAYYHDLTIIRLTPRHGVPSDYKWKAPIIELMPPSVGDRIVGFGYRKASVSVVEDCVSEGIRIFTDGTTTVGKVIDVHPERRDAGRLSFPCFQTNARFDGGMSGGPVFNHTGQLCGVVCSNLPPSSQDEEHVSYVSLLWPLMATPLDVNRAGFKKGVSYPALELARDGFIKALNWDRIALVQDEKGKVVEATFRKQPAECAQ